MELSLETKVKAIAEYLGLEWEIERPSRPIVHLWSYRKGYGGRFDLLDIELLYAYLVAKGSYWEEYGIKTQEEAQGRADAVLRRNSYFAVGKSVIIKLRNFYGRN